MTKSLAVLVISNEQGGEEERKLKKILGAILPPESQIHYSSPGHAGKNETSADLKRYDLVILSGSRANYYGTPAVLRKTSRHFKRPHI